MNLFRAVVNKAGETARLDAESRRSMVLHYLHLGWCVVSLQDKACPYCGNTHTQCFGKNAIITEVRLCPACNLRFRWPKDDDRFNRYFYQWSYREPKVTDMPGPEELAEFKKQNFKGSPQDFSEKVALVRAICPPGGKLLDFGASWGYTTYQFSQAGFSPVGFEMSKPRAKFGQTNLGVNIVDEPADLNSYAGTFDVVYASHVLEHVPTPHQTIALIFGQLKPGGVFICFVPNCDGRNARKEGMNWGPLYGIKHVLSLDKRFFAGALPQQGFDAPLFFSEPYVVADVVRSIREKRDAGDPPGDELMMYAQRPATPQVSP